MDVQNTRLEKLREKKKQLEAQIRNIEAVEKSRQRKDDTRRKILIGSYILHMAEVENTMPALIQKLDGFLTRPTDRKLFGLSTKNKK